MAVASAMTDQQPACLVETNEPGEVEHGPGIVA